MLPVLFFDHPSSLAHDPRAWSPGHPDVPERIVAIERALERASGLELERREAPAALETELRLVHLDEHIEYVRGLAAAGGGKLDADTYVGEASYVAALHAAGGACAMVRSLLAGGGPDSRPGSGPGGGPRAGAGAGVRAGFCALRPAGHHAERDRAMGFCLFNNVAVAAELAVRELGLSRVMIVDWDVHHGNGTANFFRRRDDVLVASIHQAGLFPGTGAMADVGSGAGVGYTINAPVPAGSDEEVWLSVLEHVIVPVGLEFRPELVLISAGFDAHRSDPLGGCRLESESFGQMACHVRDMAGELGAPVGAVLEGGYDLAALATSATQTIAALSGEGSAGSIAPDPLVTSRVAAHVGHHWTL